MTTRAPAPNHLRITHEENGRPRASLNGIDLFLDADDGIEITDLVAPDAATRVHLTLLEPNITIASMLGDDSSTPEPGATRSVTLDMEGAAGVPGGEVWVLAPKGDLGRSVVAVKVGCSGRWYEGTLDGFTVWKDSEVALAERLWPVGGDAQ